MIDVHTHPCGLRDKEAYQSFQDSGQIPERVLAPYLEAMRDVDKAVVLALWAPRNGIEASNAFAAAVVQQAPSKLVGFASVDPCDPGAIPQLESAVRDLGLRGLKLGPIYQRFAPDDLQLWPFYQKVQDLRIPIMWHQGASYLMPDGSLADARAILLDRVACSFPEIRMVIAHFGFPWPSDVIALLRKHPNVYTDISALYDRPWFLYNALVNALEYGAQDKVLFGSDYPPATPRKTALALRRINDFTAGTGLPRVPETVIEAIIERDSLEVLGVG
jgi:uncharacterized protein